MVRYNENAKLIASLIKDKNRLKAEIAGKSEQVQIIKRKIEVVKCELANVVINTRDTTSDTKWGYSTWNGGTWQLTYTDSQVEIARRRYVWRTVADLETGTYDNNINVSNGDIRLG